MTEQERQLKKIQLYQDIDLLEKDFLKAYPIDPRTNAPIGIIGAAPSWLYLMLTSFFIFFSVVTFFQQKEVDQIRMIMVAIICLVAIIAIKIVTHRYAPRYAQYQIDKAAYDQRHAELRRQYDAL